MQIFFIVQLKVHVIKHTFEDSEITHREHYLVKQDCALCAIFWRQNSKLNFFFQMHPWS